VSIVIFFKKKHVLNHPIFGKLTFNDLEYVGELYFEPAQNTVGVYFSSSDKDFKKEYDEVWKKLDEAFISIRQKSADIINISDFDIYKPEISQEKLYEKNLSLEGLAFGRDLSVKLFWGVVTQEQSETSIQVVTLFNSINDEVVFLGGGD
jgi:hypothetical protein